MNQCCNTHLNNNLRMRPDPGSKIAHILSAMRMGSCRPLLVGRNGVRAIAHVEEEGAHSHGHSSGHSPVSRFSHRQVQWGAASTAWLGTVMVSASWRPVDYVFQTCVFTPVSSRCHAALRMCLRND